MAKSKKSISQISIFGEYKSPENRVTAALLHIIHVGGNVVIQRLFGDIFDIPSNDIDVIPQSNQTTSIPDGELSCECNYHIFIESKIVPNAINLKQLNEHKKLSNVACGNFLIYITPDSKIPSELTTAKVEWISWETVIDRLQGIIADGIAYDLLKYLIRQFVILINHTIYAIPTDQSVIIVGGSFGENVALHYGFYACQPNRKFRPSKYLAFYHQNRIKYLFEIVTQRKCVDIQTLKNVNRTNYFTVIEPNYVPQVRDYYQLKKVCNFNPEILNDKKDKNGKPCAYTMGQTYTTYNKIMKAKKTSDL